MSEVYANTMDGMISLRKTVPMKRSAWRQEADNYVQPHLDKKELDINELTLSFLSLLYLEL